MTQGISPTRAAPPRPAGRLALAGGVGVVVALALFVVGLVHTPETTGLFGLQGVAVIRLKAQVATVVLVLAVTQLTTALWMYRRLPGLGRARPPVRMLHRICGATLFLLSLPVAAQCVLAYGVQLNGLRVAVHSLAGCFFYGAFAAKMLVVRSRRLPGWALPLAGGSLVSLVVVLWYSGALWYFAGFRLPLP